MLTSVNSVELYQKGLITNAEQIKLELINENHRVQQLLLLRKLPEPEQNYVRIIALWLANEKDYYKDISPYLLKSDEDIIPAKKDSIETSLTQYGFCELPKVKALDDQKRKSLFSLIKQKPIPYKLAMLNYIGFIEHSTSNHFKTKYRLNKFLAGLFETADRDIKGHLSVLNPVSKERKNRYTAYLHKEAVEKDYQNLK